MIPADVFECAQHPCRLISLKLEQREGRFAINMGALVQDVKQGVLDVKNQVGAQMHKLGGKDQRDQRDVATRESNGTTARASTTRAADKTVDGPSVEMAAVGSSGVFDHVPTVPPCINLHVPHLVHRHQWTRRWCSKSVYVPWTHASLQCQRWQSRPW